MNIQTRPLASHDYEQWLPYWKAYLDFYKSPFNEQQAKLTWQRLGDAQFNMHGFIAESDQQAVGFVHCLFHPSTWTANDYCYLQDLFVAPDLRGQGIGRKLIQTVVAFAKSRSADRVYWLTQESNQAGRLLYDKVAQQTGFIHYRIAPL
jgi:ribosomal protein S18 acetylase RimI-like enzyme